MIFLFRDNSMKHENFFSLKALLSIVITIIIVLLICFEQSISKNKVRKNNLFKNNKIKSDVIEKDTMVLRKSSVLNIGNVSARISNGATLGYDRWGESYEFPRRSGITYHWTIAPLIGAMKKDSLGLVTKKFVASGTRGAARFSEEEFSPLIGYDAGYENAGQNIGIAFSDKPESWPTNWPLGPNEFPVDSTGRFTYPSFKGIANGTVMAPREAYFVVCDNDSSSGYFNVPQPMNIRVDVWAMQYEQRDIVNKNVIIYRHVIRNIGTDTLFNVYVGVHDDPDCPEQGTAEWTDDFAAFIKEGEDVSGYPQKSDSLLWNFVYTWDGDNLSAGFVEDGVGWAGIKFLETPQNLITGQQSGITTLQVFEYSNSPQTEEGEYEQLAAGIIPPDNIFPHPNDYTQTPNSYGPDVTVVASSGPYTIFPGEKLQYSYAVIHGKNKNELFQTAMNCQMIFKQNFHAQSIYMQSFTVDYISPLMTIIRCVINAENSDAASINCYFKKYDSVVVSQMLLYDDGNHDDGEAGDKIFGNSLSLLPQNAGLKLDVDVLFLNNYNYTSYDVMQNISTADVDISNLIVASDNLNDDGIVNPGENIRYTFTLSNNSNENFSHLQLQSSVESKKILIANLSAQSILNFIYDSTNAQSYFSFNVPSNYSDSIFSIIITMSDSNQNQWLDTLKFLVIPSTLQHYGSTINHIGGYSDWEFKVRIVDSTIAINHSYEITINDSIDSLGNKGFTLKDITTGALLLQNSALPDEFAHNIPVIDGFKIMRGDKWGSIGLWNDSVRWLGENGSLWFRGFRFKDDFDLYSAFNGGVTIGSSLSLYSTPFGNFISSSFRPSESYTVKILFDTSNTQKAYRLRRSSNGYTIQSSNPFVSLPFTVWDIQNSSNPRQLTVAWIDSWPIVNGNSIWDPAIGNDRNEIIFIYNKSYDSTGLLQFSMPPNAIPNEATIGFKADIMYGLSLAIDSGHALNENSGALYLRPYMSITSRDTFTFNPTILNVSYIEVPLNFALYQNYPNPFNPITTIRFSIPQQEHIKIKIYDILGKEIVTIINDMMEMGEYQIQFHAGNFASGIYFYRLEAGKFFDTKKMLLLK